VDQAIPTHSYALNQLWARIGKDAAIDNFALNLGGRLAREDIRVVLDAPGAHVALNGVFLGDGERLLDTATIIRHAREHTTSDEKYRGVLADKSVGVFQGRIEVRPDAQKIEGHQMTRGLLLSERAKAHFKPELEIFADDVKCSHGSTIGQLDEAALFYLRSRGLPLAIARRLLIDAFVEEGLDDVGDEALRAWVGEAAAAWVRR
ncbi:MAG: SufD family Fe-S cluster assembly protein, partial [Pseudomonadota bacterium]